MEREQPGLEVAPAEVSRLGIETAPLETQKIGFEVAAPQANDNPQEGEEGKRGKGFIWINVRRPIPLWLFVAVLGVGGIIILVAVLLGILLRQRR